MKTKIKVKMEEPGQPNPGQGVKVTVKRIGIRKKGKSNASERRVQSENDQQEHQDRG